MTKMKQTDLFLNVNGKEYVDEIFNRKQTVYKIDDCLATISTAKADVNSSLSPILNKYGRTGVSKIIENYMKVINTNIPVKSFEEYLKELKDCISSSADGEVRLGDLERVYINLSATTVVAHVIIVGKEGYGGKPILINELFADGHYVKTTEYALEDLVEMYSKLSQPENIMEKHKRLESAKAHNFI